jgi:drug/metabolite transporter (DMT)-like permease
MIDKKATESVNSYSLGLFKIGFEVILFPFLLFYGWKYNLIQWNNKAIILAIVSCSLTTIADFSMLHLLSKTNLSWAMSMTTPLSLSIGIISGVILFKENLSYMQISAIGLIVIGVYILNNY